MYWCPPTVLYSWTEDTNTKNPTNKAIEAPEKMPAKYGYDGMRDVLKKERIV